MSWGQEIEIECVILEDVEASFREAISTERSEVQQALRNLKDKLLARKKTFVIEC